jgi:hypothetical protein
MFNNMVKEKRREREKESGEIETEQANVLKIKRTGFNRSSVKRFSTHQFCRDIN